MMIQGERVCRALDTNVDVMSHRTNTSATTQSPVSRAGSFHREFERAATAARDVMATNAAAEEPEYFLATGTPVNEYALASGSPVNEYALALGSLVNEYALASGAPVGEEIGATLLSDWLRDVKSRVVVMEEKLSLRTITQEEFNIMRSVHNRHELMLNETGL